MIVDEQDFIPLKITNKGILRLSPFNNGLYSIIDFADRFILEQCTGLKDKNRKLIFEGDIVQDDCGWIDGNRIFTVKYSEHFKRLHLVPKESYSQFSKFEIENGVHIFDWTFPDIDLSIIGNIHDNPELLNT